METTVCAVTFACENTAAKRLRMRDLPHFRFDSLAKMSPHESRYMAAVRESVPCWFTFFLERSRLVGTQVSNGMYSLRTSMLCKTFASPIQLVSSENLLLENFISWEKSCETGKFFTQFLM